MTAPSDPPPPDQSIARPLIVGALLLVSAVALGVYVKAERPGNNVVHTGACAKSLDRGETIASLIHGEVAALQIATHPNDLGNIAFDDADGRKTNVAAFKGKTILLNLWATWCVPCRTEMPSLDKLQATAGSEKFSVVPVSVDTTRLERARAFFKDHDIKALPYYSDSSGDILHTFKRRNVDGLPTTILIGADSCEIGTMAGPAPWDSPEAKAVIERLLRDEAVKPPA